MRRRWRLLLALTGALTVAAVGRAAEIGDIVHDTQREAHSNGELTMVWWMPQAFWEASMSANPMVTPEARDQVLNTLQEYSIFALVHAKLGSAGLDAPQSRADLLQHAKLDIGGKVIEPIAPESLNPAAQALLASLKPAMAQMAGQFGKAMEIVVYPARQDGKLLLDPTHTGSFSYALYDESFTWRLPLGSLLPPKFDPRTHEQFPGNYEFNPFTGTKLSVTKK
ncbi:MAG TPA: hypothetical protein VLW26_12680 [Steroidobacteraceae bacterium]|nr:hypothetical protein [Steroidobacteraceae bacterium]